MGEQRLPKTKLRGNKKTSQEITHPSTTFTQARFTLKFLWDPCIRVGMITPCILNRNNSYIRLDTSFCTDQTDCLYRATGKLGPLPTIATHSAFPQHQALWISRHCY